MNDFIGGFAKRAHPARARYLNVNLARRNRDLQPGGKEIEGGGGGGEEEKEAKEEKYEKDAKEENRKVMLRLNCVNAVGSVSAFTARCV